MCNKRSTEEERSQFKRVIQQKLEEIQLPASFSSCSDVHCENEDHINTSDDIMAAILQALDGAAMETLHREKPHKKCN